MKQTHFSPRIRIEKIELKNIKGVNNGIIEFNCLKNPDEKETCSDILGLYGQNGSGKTTLLEALHIVKLAMMGQSVPYEVYGDIVAQGAESARIATTFLVSNQDETYYHLEYAFSLGIWETPDEDLGKEENSADKIAESLTASKPLSKALSAAIVAGSLLIPGAVVAGAAGYAVGKIWKYLSGEREGEQSTEKSKSIAIFDEVLTLSGTFDGVAVRQAPIIDTRTTETVFLPKAKQKAFFPNLNADMLNELQKCKRDTLIESRSFVFSKKVSQLLINEKKGVSEYARIIINLKAYAIWNLRVLDSFDNNATVSTGDSAFLLYTAARGVKISKIDSTTLLDEDGLKTLRTAIKSLNVILQEIIPGLTLEAVRQVDIDLEKGSTRKHAPSSKVTVYSVRDNVRIPLAKESAGIIRLISSIGMFSYAFANQDVTVAIDEIDAGVYEYLLGQLLEIFEKYGCGQLIFTCHNLRPMERLDKKFIYFTTTNPDNRYLKPKNIRNENNLRDVYLKEILAGGQDEELYAGAKEGRIAAALQKAGEIIGEE